MALSIEWTKHIPASDQKRKEDFEGAIRNSTIALGRLYQLLEDREARALRTSVSDYNSPSWSHQQADVNGYRRCIRELLDLLSFLKR